MGNRRVRKDDGPSRPPAKPRTAAGPTAQADPSPASREPARPIARATRRKAARLSRVAEIKPAPRVQMRRRRTSPVQKAAGRRLRARLSFQPARWLRHLHRKSSLRVKLILLAALLLAPVWFLNLAAAYFGNSVIFPLSPFFLREKASALMTYAAHRPACLLLGHPDIDALSRRAEVRQRLPRGLLAALVQVESGGRPHSISSAGAMGPGQLMPGTARMLGVADPFDSAENVDGAARLLASHLARFRSTRLAVAAYNAGPGAIHGRVPNNGQTPVYVERVMRAHAAFRGR